MIVIRVVSRAGAPLDVPLSARFGEAGGDIGRGSDCALVLLDPDRHISRRQVKVTSHAGRFFARTVGSGVSVDLNGASLAADVEYELAVGAELRITPYVLRVEAVAPAVAPSAAPSPAPAARPTPPKPPRAAEDPLAHFSSPAQAPRVSAFQGLLDNPDTPPPPALAGPEIDLVVGGTSGISVRPSAGAEPPARTRTPDDPVAALYAGLGQTPAGAGAGSPERMRLVGELLRAMVEGMLGLLAARTIAKRELGVSQTQLQTRQNNTLKFSPDAEAALGHLLGDPEQGFLSPRDAVRDAFDDLRAHQLAVLAGMRAALEAVVGRFDPMALEQRLAPPDMWENLIPTARRAKLWEHYGEQYAAIVREVEGDFDTLFGRAFLKAYEAQLVRLTKPGAGDR